MAIETKQPKLPRKRLPKGVDTMIEAASRLTFPDKVKLRDALSKSIDADVAQMKQNLAAAEQLITSQR